MKKFEKVIEKILLGIFTILCIGAFFLVVQDLPYSICSIIGYEEYDGGYEILSFFACCALLGYVMDYYKEKRSNELLNITCKHNAELKALKNIFRLYKVEGINISKIYVSDYNKVQITILNKYNISIELHLFDKISTEDDFLKLDLYISEFLNNNKEPDMKDTIQKSIYISNFEKFVSNYFENI